MPGSYRAGLLPVRRRWFTIIITLPLMLVA